MVGYVGKVIVNGGYGIDVIAGVNADGKEWSRALTWAALPFLKLRAWAPKSREKAFTDQFVNKLSPIRVIKASGNPKTDSSVDAITAATILKRGGGQGQPRAKQIELPSSTWHG